jgi:S1-C subfamily serine protease
MDFNLFTQIVLVIGRLEPQGVVMLGTGFLISKDGLIATTHHVIGSSTANLVVLAPHIQNQSCPEI